MSYEKDLSQARDIEEFIKRIDCLKRDLEYWMFDPIFGCLPVAIEDELKALMKHFGL